MHHVVGNVVCEHEEAEEGDTDCTHQDDILPRNRINFQPERSLSLVIGLSPFFLLFQLGLGTI
jgi:hypothetical protein